VGLTGRARHSRLTLGLLWLGARLVHRNEGEAGRGLLARLDIHDLALGLGARLVHWNEGEAGRGLLARLDIHELALGLLWLGARLVHWNEGEARWGLLSRMEIHHRGLLLFSLLFFLQFLFLGIPGCLLFCNFLHSRGSCILFPLFLMLLVDFQRRQTGPMHA